MTGTAPSERTRPSASRKLLEDVVPLTPLQQGIYFHSALAEDADDVYVVQQVLELTSVPGRELDEGTLRRSAQALLDRHATLRTCFRLRRNGDPIGVVLRTVEVPWRTVDLREDREDAEDASYPSVRAADAAQRFDPAVAPLLRFTLVRLRSNRWRLIFTSHHLLLDGWSIPLLIRELLEVYAAGGDAAVLPPVRPFKRYLTWLATRDPEEGARAWAAYLEGLDGPTSIAPSGAARSPEMPAVQRIAVTHEVGTGMVNLARSAGITPNTVVQTAWAILLGSLTGRTDITFGAVVSGRVPEVADIEAMIGLFINTVPVRIRLDPNEAGRRLLDRVRTESVSVMDHQHVGLTEIARRTGMSDLFDTVVVFESYPVDSAALARAQRAGGLTVEAVEGRDATNFPLALVVQMDTTLDVAIEYQPSLFAAADIEEYGDRLVDIIVWLSTASTTDQLGAYPIRKAVLPPVREMWRPVAPSTMLTAVSECVDNHGPHPAVVGGGQSITFDDLDRRSNQLARCLIDRGVGPEVPVVVVTARTVDAIVALWAVIKAGGVYVPLDPASPSTRSRGIVADVRPMLVLASSATADVGADAARSICPVLVLERPGDVDPDAQSSDRVTDLDRRGPVLPDSAVYVIFTSGSTGRPKGVTVTHRGLSALLSSHRRALHDPIAAKAGRERIGVAHAWSLGFDASWQPLLWMFSGHKVHIADRETMRDPVLLARMMIDDRLDFVEVTPSVLDGAIAAGMLSDPAHRPAAVGFGGEAAGDSLWSTLRGARMTAVNLYGPTESTVDALVAHVGDTPRPAVGSPVDGSGARVLDTWLRPVPYGAAGELYVSGAGLARGYVGAAGVTATRFVADPFGAPGTRMYRTGDVVTVERDDLLRFFGRADDQVKIRGHRVELGEIESALQAIDAIAESVVTVHVDDRGAARLVGYVRGFGAPVDGPTLRRVLAATLPDYMIPAAIVTVERFATTTNGKIDKAALPNPDFAALVSATAPRDEIESSVASVVAAALGLDQVGIDDDFFALGGDSIVSIQLVSLVRARRLNVTARDVFEGRTVAGIAARVRARTAAGPEPGVRASAVEAVGDIPPTPVVVTTIRRGGAFRRFCQARLLITPESTTEADLVAAARCLLDTHPILRSVLSGTGDEVRWTVPESDPAHGAQVVRRVDVCGLSAAEFMGVLERERELTFRAIDPAAGRIVRMVWFDRGAGQAGRLLVIVHHLAIDGVSWRILVPDLAAAWSAVRRGHRPELLSAGTSFREWAIGLRRAAASERLRAQKPLWAAIDAGADLEPRLGGRALDPARDRVGDVSRAVSPVTIETSIAVLDYASSTGVGVDHVLAAALAVTVVRITGRNRPLRIDIESHGRVEHLVDGVDLSRTVGWFTAIAPVLLDVTGGRAAACIVAGVAEQMRAIPDGGVGHGVLRNVGALARVRGPEILFNYLGRSTLGENHGESWSGAPEVGALGGTIDPATPADHVLQFDALIEDSADGPLLVCEWAGVTGVLAAEGTRRISSTFVDVLIELTHPEAKERI
ncbi:non-ribosomal peptide synthetase [Millisia brevis]|uniref:non-ribosomal peptide synthetase n=1 Tax=Millisia brevis TaxID=264148 RepID=UPI00082ECA38|nr:non-ribosomal peptide synthetase [Millisia brevis]